MLLASLQILQSLGPKLCWFQQGPGVLLGGNQRGSSGAVDHGCSHYPPTTGQRSFELAVKKAGEAFARCARARERGVKRNRGSPRPERGSNLQRQVASRGTRVHWFCLVYFFSGWDTLRTTAFVLRLFLRCFGWRGGALCAKHFVFNGSLFLRMPLAAVCGRANQPFKHTGQGAGVPSCPTLRHMAMGQNPVPAVNIPITTKMVPLVLTHSHILKKSRSARNPPRTNHHADSILSQFRIPFTPGGISDWDLGES